MADDDTEHWYRVKLVIGVHTYGKGETPAAALAEAVARVTTKPAFEEEVVRATVLKEWVGGTALTYEKMMKDAGPESWKT